jgi:hypothetical protein
MLSKKRTEIIKRILDRLDEFGKSEYWMVKNSGIASSKWTRFKQNDRYNLSHKEFMSLSLTLGVDANYLYYGNKYEKVLYEDLNKKISEQEKEITVLKEELKEYNSIKNILGKKKKK